MHLYHSTCTVILLLEFTTWHLIMVVLASPLFSDCHLLLPTVGMSLFRVFCMALRHSISFKLGHVWGRVYNNSMNVTWMCLLLQSVHCISVVSWILNKQSHCKQLVKVNTFHSYIVGGLLGNLFLRHILYVTSTGSRRCDLCHSDVLLSGAMQNIHLYYSPYPVCDVV